MEEQSNPWKGAFWVLITIILIGTVGVLAYLLGKGNLGFSKLVSTSPSPSPASQLQSPPTLAPVVDETEAIKEAIYVLVGSDATKVNVTISENTGTHATGGVVDWSSEVGGGYWIAAKTGGEWVGVYGGQSHPTCSQIAPYNFPTSMVPECLDGLGKVITR
ncbi:hypothetical protein KKH23_03375 [Patescibacteria group bacterium]|nr:hypothetical protein [Patescibacteria group bacterium]MBU0776833.1 hypothetical protein [Patescibacteria group bacterium]MBU0846206.1 hypothetical protein [Patescibacteria group bacterium]MBU0922634.1 hypothetical protein [Patescibacteria group bacterium]MBU1066685.1 hypothetical protein [Patescibacteria group bacterium]